MRSVTVLETAAQLEDERVTVAVVAADEVVRRRIVSVLAAAGDFVSRQVASAEELRVDPQDPSLRAVAIAYRGSADDRAAAIRQSKNRLPDAHVVLIGVADTNGMHKAFDAGADGFVFEADLERTLTATLRAVCSGQLVVPPVMRSSVVRPALTHREKQTLGLAVLGLTNSEIAQRLFLAESTVKCHMTSIFGKLGVRSRSEAAAHVLDPQYGLGLGILKLSEDQTPLGMGS